MLISAHVLVGTALGRALTPVRTPPPARRPLALPRLALLVTAGVASHLLCDALPHWGMTERGVVPPGGVRTGGARDGAFLAVAVPDGLVGLGLLWAAISREHGARRSSVAAVVAGACLPDLDKVGDLLVGRSPWPAAFDAFHGAIQRESPRRLGSDIASVAVAAALVFSRRTP